MYRSDAGQTPASRSRLIVNGIPGQNVPGPAGDVFLRITPLCGSWVIRSANDQWQRDTAIELACRLIVYLFTSCLSAKLQTRAKGDTNPWRLKTMVLPG